jgi:predicted CxxxxCH...CXXCH cytochrome family protein
MTDSRFVVKTHSSGNTSNKYGNWSIECRTCHNPHYQDQVSSYPLDANADLLTGTIGSFSQPPLSAAETVIPLVGGSLVDNAWIDFTFVPNTAYPTRMYRIKSNTAGSVTVYGPVNVRYTPPNSPFAIRYGKMVLGQISIPFVGRKPVKFFRDSGADSFGTSTDPANITSICQVCHGSTSSFNNAGTLEGPNHPALQAGGNCTQCHTHASGFKPECGSCHGNPPLVNTRGGPNGLANSEGGTGATTPGAHVKHAISAGYPCETCHENGMPVSNIYDKKIQIGFNIAGGVYRSGSYDGRSSLANGYTYTRGNPGTNITTGGTKACSNVYCHGSTMAPNGGTDITPVWDDPSTAVCGTCHGATATIPPTRGSHYKHARTDLLGYAYPCRYCHRDPSIDASFHVNGRSEAVFSSDPSATGGIYSGTPAMLDAYGTCTNVYCHSTVQSSPPGGAPVYRVTPVWGDTIWSCGECHEYSPNLATGSHGMHMQQPELQECWPCHNYTNSDDGCMACHDANTIEPQRDRHANHSIDVAFAPKYGGNYSGTPAPGDAYGKCSTVYCHSTVQGNPDPLQPPSYATPTWGQPFSGTCGMGACHPVGNAHQGDTGYALLTTGSHSKHLRYKFDQDGNCQSCHYDPSYGGCVNCHRRTVNHADRSIDVVFNPAFPTAAGGASGAYTGDTTPRTPYGGCRDLYCHSPGTAGSPPYSSPNTTVFAWGGTLPNDCTGCHNGDRNTTKPMRAGSHGRHIASYQFDCSVCHITTVSDSRTISPAIYFGTQTLGYRNHANGWINVAFSSATASNGTYAGQASPVNMKVPGSAYGSCGNIYCHTNGTGGTANVAPSSALPPLGDPRPMASKASATWGTPGPLACTSCHGYPPSYLTADVKSNSHLIAEHMQPCNFCHYATTTNGTTITNPANHANRLYNVQPDPAAIYPGTYYTNPVNFTYIYDAGGGRCDTVSCHPGGSSMVWGRVSILATIYPTVGPSCNDILFDTVVFADPTGAPYTYYWNFGDGATGEGFPISHSYSSPGTYTVVLTGRDKAYHPYSSTTTVSPQASNILPVVSKTLSLKRYTLTITDASYDPDCNTCGHAGNGRIEVLWDGGTTATTDTAVNLCSPTNNIYSHVYPSATANYTLRYSVTDNAGGTVSTINAVSLPGPITIQGTITHADGSPFSGVPVYLYQAGGPVQTSTTTDAAGNYTLTRVWLFECYDVRPVMGSTVFTPTVQTNICDISGNINFVGP